MNLENIILSEVTHPQKNTHDMYSTLGKDRGISMIQLMDYMKLKRKEDQTVGALVLLGRLNNVIKGSRG